MSRARGRAELTGAAARACEQPLTVLKFGSSVLASEEDLPAAVHEIYRYVRLGHRVVAVTSALGRTTDSLLVKAGCFSDAPDPAGLAALLATGETTSAALLGLALGRAGVPAMILDPRSLGLRTRGPLLDALPCDLDTPQLLRLLEERPVAVLPGFFGRTAEGQVALLGRGGSDLTALFLAHRLGAGTCRLLKNVDGVYASDPADGHSSPLRYGRLSYADALDLEARVVQGKALRFAEKHGVVFEVASPGAESVTRVGPWRTLPAPAPAPRRLRVVLLGLGTVGLGVYRHLAARPDRFEVLGAVVRSPEKHMGDGVPDEILTSDPAELLELPADVVVETMGGQEPAATLIAEALIRGRDVVTSNKQVIAHAWHRLKRASEKSGSSLSFSAAAGGSVPVLETVTRLAGNGRIRSLEGVLNGTTNFVLDRMAEGKSLSKAVSEAQRLGFAEADPSCDLDGTDAARKLAILARAAFGVGIDPASIPRFGIESLGPDSVRRARSAGKVLRLLASCRRTRAGLRARVRPALLAPNHPLARCRQEQNALRIEREEGPAVFVSGKGAGRWPTSEAVMADLLDLWRERCRRVSARQDKTLSSGERASGIRIPTNGKREAPRRFSIVG